MLLNNHYHDINPRLAGYEDCAPGHGFGPARRGCWLLHYVFSGSGSFEAGGSVHTLSRGQIFIIRPGETTYYRADRTDPWSYCWIGFETGLELPPAFSQPVIDAPQSGHIFAAVRDCGGLETGREPFLCGKIFELLALLAPGAPAQDRVRDYVRAAQNFIESNYASEVTVAQMARRLNLDRSYFSTIFKSRTGKSPQQYLVDFRLQRAAELLTEGVAPGEAARSTGYHDIFNFSRMFSRRYGVAPSHYAARR